MRKPHQPKASRQRETVQPRIHFRLMNRCTKCGADQLGYDFVIQDDEPGERTATPEELMTHGFRVAPASVDMVATLIAQQIAKWNGLTRSIPGRDDPRHVDRPDRKVGSSGTPQGTQGRQVAQKARRPKS